MITYCISNNKSLLTKIKELNSTISIIRCKNGSELSDFFDIITHKNEEAIIIVISSDYLENIDYIQKICDLFENTNADICIISRSKICKLDILKASFLKKVIIYEERFIANILFPEFIDPFSSYFAVKSSVLKNKLSYKSGLYSLPDILGKCKWNKIEEIQLKKIPSKMNLENNYKTGYVQIIKPILQGINLSIYAVLYHDSYIWKEIKRVLKFLTVGISGTIINTGILFLLTEYAGLYYMFSSVIAIETSIITNFLLNDFWTFSEKHNNISKKYARFFSYQLICTAGLLINITILYLLTNFVNMWYLLANLIAIICVFIWDFLINRNITWNTKKEVY